MDIKLNLSGNERSAGVDFINFIYQMRAIRVDFSANVISLVESDL